MYVKLLFISFILLFFRPSVIYSQNQKPAYTVFLLGDAGEPQLNGKDKTLNLLKQQIETAGKESTIIYLGDNIYPLGMPDAEDKTRSKAEANLTEQLKIVQNFEGKVFIIAGNHDWKKGKDGGWSQVRNQEKFAENYLNRGNVFLPDNGCPGPVEISLNNELTLILIDTQWWLHPWEKPGTTSDCDCKTEADVIRRLQEMLSRNRDKKVMVAGHHPMYSYGEHNGAANLKSHIFPLTEANKKLYIPLPVIGSILPLYRQFLGNIQDTHHPKYRLMQKSITESLKKYSNTIYANGHDHDLQYIYRDSLHFITSGAGSKQTLVKNRKYSKFAESKNGFARVDYYENGEVRLEFWEGEKPEKAAYSSLLYKEIKTPKPVEIKTQNNISFEGKTQLVAGSDKYKASKTKIKLLGENYRKEWAQPIEVPVFDLGTEQGGLKILQRGGGMQTNSLRFEDPTGKQFVVRSVEKNPEKAIPDVLRGTFAADLVQDQISASHPYAALAVPLLAEAGGVPHSNPKLVYIPDDPRFGIYQKLFANTLAIFEEREIIPENSKNKTYSTLKVVEKLQEDNDNLVNQAGVARARLLDVLISDWDRHDDNWRWSAQEKGKKIIFNVIPRDRDQALFVNEGVFPKIISRKWIMPKIQGFGYKIRDVTTLIFNGRYFDRSFLTGVSKETWINTAEDLQKNITNEVIEKAIHQLPEPIFKLRGQEIIDKLKSRREILKVEAEKYYLFLAQNCDVLGSDKNEFFVVKRLDDSQTNVKVFKINKDGDTTSVLFERTYNTSETKEVRLYGLGGDDVFTIDGNVKKGIKIRIIGGEGKDKIIDNSTVSGLGKNSIVYDTKSHTEIKTSSETKIRTSNDPEINKYDRLSFKYNLFQPLTSIQYNIDDGIFLGGGLLIRKQGFRKDSFAVQHKITANHAFATKSYNFDYQGDFTKLIGSVDLEINAEVKSPNYTTNYFGLGNESVYNKDVTGGINYYRTRFEILNFNALFIKRSGKRFRFFAGPNVESVEVEESKGRYINDLGNGLDKNTLFERKNYVGLIGGFQIDNRDNRIMPTQGIYWHTEAKYMRGIGDLSKNYSQIKSEVSFYWTLRLPAKVTIATRFGGGVNLSDYEFFQANQLSGITNLRGFRRTRFAGKDDVYNNTEVRIHLFSFKTYIFPAYFGVVGFHDIGRVWVKNDQSAVWHNSYGGGIWLAPFKMFVVSAMYGFSNEGNLPLVRAGFFF